MTTALVEPVALVRAETGDFTLACQREWLVTNGLGGFASGTVGGALTRRYHGLLVAALKPPVQRTVLVAKLEIGVQYGGHEDALGSNEYADGTVDPQGHRLIESVSLDGGVLVWRYALGDALLEQRVWMKHGKNTTFVQLSLVRGSIPAALQITPLCCYRDYHSLSRGGWPLGVTAVEHGCRIDAFEGAQPFWIRADGATFELTPDWHWGFRYRVETERRLDDTGDLFRPGRLHASLRQGESLLIELSLRPENLWVPRWSKRLLQSILPYENRGAEVPERVHFCHSEFQSATAAAAGSAELSTAAGGRRSRRTHDRRGGQLVSDAQIARQTPTNSPEEPNFPTKSCGLNPRRCNASRHARLRCS